MANYIIDGHNLIGKMPGLSLSMPDDEERLIELLEQFGLANRGKLEVYFDGAPVGQAGVRNFGRVRAYFVPARQTADDAIRRRLSQMKKTAKAWTVVTSDRSIQAAAREANARVVSAEDFARQLRSSLQRPKAGNGENMVDEPVSEADVKEWLAIFKERGKKK